MMFKYDWSEHSTPFVKMSYADYVPAGSNFLSSSANVVLGLNWKAFDYLGGSLQAGKSKVSNANMDTQIAADIQYAGQRTGLVLNASRQVSSSGLGGFVTVDQANG